MFFITIRRLVLSLLIATVGLVFPAQMRAELVWNPDTGWRIEGGALSGLLGSEGRNALELMNKGRRAEDRGNLRAALKAYKKVINKYGTSIYTPEALYRSAKLYLERKQYAKAFDAFQGIVTRYPN